MGSYLDTLSAAQKHNAQVLVERMKVKGITNPNTHAAILAVISKESAFTPKSENLNYSAARISQVWTKIPAATATQLANSPEKLGNYVYGPGYNKTLGNGEGEGYKYRGRGYNQITGKSNYKNIGSKIGIDLVASPDALNDPQTAADAAIIFFQEGINSLAHLGKLSQYNATNINDFKTPQDSLGAIYHVNAGVGSTKAKIDADTTGGKAAATSRIGELFTFIGHTANEATEVVKKNPLPVMISATAIALGVFFLYKAVTGK